MTDDGRDELELPILIAGRVVESTGITATFEYDDVVVRLPGLRSEDVDEILDTPTDLLADLSIDDITIFLAKAGEAWRDRTNPWRRTADEWAHRITGYAPLILKVDLDYLAGALTRPEMYDLLETDLGDPAVLDEWTRFKTTQFRCWPQGRVTHVMVGNVPMAGLFTLMRSILTKNVSVAKMARRDVVVPLCFAMCIRDVDPDHPIARSLSVCYWEPEGEIEDRVLAQSDAVTVWGREETLASIRRRSRPGCELIEFGPKRSLSLVLEPPPDIQRTAFWIAYDVSGYDQEGCFSTQDVVVIGDGAAELASAIATELARVAETLPPRPLSDDAAAHVQLARLASVAEGDEIVAGDGLGWTVVLRNAPQLVGEHPLTRTLYVHQLDNLDEAYAFIDRSVQTVGVEPAARATEVADALTRRGADRVVPVGFAFRMREGFIHDGFHPMRRMVRWVTVERGMATKYKFGTHTADEDYARFRRWLTPG